VDFGLSWLRAVAVDDVPSLMTSPTPSVKRLKKYALRQQSISARGRSPPTGVDDDEEPPSDDGNMDQNDDEDNNDNEDAPESDTDSKPKKKKKKDKKGRKKAKNQNGKDEEGKEAKNENDNNDDNDDIAVPGNRFISGANDDDDDEAEENGNENQGKKAKNIMAVTDVLLIPLLPFHHSL
jgi:cobalamin biosynthesis protein CobT